MTLIDLKSFYPFLFFTFIIYVLIQVVVPCSENCLIGQEHCDPVTNSCLYGCKAGWTGKTCIGQCSITNCLECYTLKNNTEVCSHCKEGYYGDQCENTCNDKCLSLRCNALGDCVFGCKNHWTGRKCDQQICVFDDCIKCSFSTVFYIPICEICTLGKFYSYEVNNCINCSNKCIGGSETCNQTTGVCFRGCEQGYYGTNCDRTCTISNCQQCELAYTNSDIPKCVQCSPGWYPKDLDCAKCDGHCYGGIDNCNSRTGHCEVGCDVGWFGSLCNKQCTIPNCRTCSEDKFGRTYCAFCNNGMYFDMDSGMCVNCSSNCYGGIINCDMNSGTCLEGCISGYTGTKCQWKCGNCSDGSCYMNGTCHGGCNPGWYGPFCSQKYPEHCIDGGLFLRNGSCEDCEASWYGDICDKRCSSNCRPSSYNLYVYCHKITGKCISGCLPGFYGDSCTVSCNPNCNYKNCDQTTGKCQNGCDFKYYGAFCDSRCPENCDTKSFPCDSTTGACSKGCLPGYFGRYCDLNCNGGCKDNTCYQLNGACSNGCYDGYYGNQCETNCSESCLGSVCDPFNGKCSKGCVPGYYGVFCKQICSNNCKNSTCDQDSGRCLLGCEDGMRGTNCNEVCPAGTFGENCASTCSLCRNNLCDAKTGTCRFGCALGYSGPLCEDVVPLYGTSNNDFSQNDTITISSSVSASVLVTVIITVLVIIIVRRKKNICLCKKTRKRSKADKPDDNIENVDAHPAQSTAQLEIRTTAV